MADALISLLTNFSVSRFAPCLVRVKISTCCQSFSLIKCATKSRLWACGTMCTVCSTISDAVLRLATSIKPGLLSKPSASFLISSEKVAENNKFWRFCGNNFNIFLISRIKPISNMRSASSNTKISIPDKSTFF